MNWEAVSVPLPQLLVAGLLLLAAIAFWFALARAARARRRRRVWLNAQAAEAAAPRLLRRRGYSVVQAQVEGRYSLVVDGQPRVILLRADYLVTRDGQYYIAEVKSGRFAPQLSNAATRRQLLEYLVAFGVQGVLLVDGETESVHEVLFPLPRRRPSSSARRYVYTAAALALVASALGLLYYQYGG